MANFLVRLSRAIFAIFVVIVSTGCAGRGSLPKSFPADVRDWAGTLDRVEFLQDLNISDYARVRVEAVDISRTTLPAADSNTYEPVQRVLGRAADYLAEGVRAHLSIPVETSFDAGDTGKTLLLRASVTEIDPGSAALRAWVGFGSGKAHTAMSGEIIDSSSGRRLLRFENAHSGSGALGLGIEGYTDLLGGQIRDTGRNVGSLLSAFSAAK